MRIVAVTRLRELAAPWPQARGEVDAWIARVRLARWLAPDEVRQTDVRVSILANRRAVFDVCHNQLRLVVKIDYEEQQVFIRWFGTHAEYDRINASEV